MILGGRIVKQFDLVYLVGRERFKITYYLFGRKVRRFPVNHHRCGLRAGKRERLAVRAAHERQLLNEFMRVGRDFSVAHCLHVDCETPVFHCYARAFAFYRDTFYCECLECVFLRDVVLRGGLCGERAKQ